MSIHRPFVLMMAVVLHASVLQAQPVAAPPAPPPAPPSDSTADDERGTLLLSSGREMRLTLGGYLQVDGRWVSGSTAPSADGLLLRRARLVFDAVRADGWHVRLQPDFGQGRVQVQDAFVGYERAGMVVRAGRFRPAFGTERMQSSATLLAPERGIVNSLMPSRSFGAQLVAERGAWRVAAGGFRTPIGSDVAAVDTDGDVNAVSGIGYDVLVRVARSHAWRGGSLEVQAGMLLGSEQGTADAPALSRVVSVAQQPILTFVDDGGGPRTVRAAGARARYSTGILLNTTRTVVAAEGAWLRQQVARDGHITSPAIGAGTARVARVWNGTRAGTQEITPTSGRGAIEVGLRAGTVAAWGAGLDTLITRRSSTHARTAGVAVSWLPTRLTRMTAALDVTTRQRTVLPTEHALTMRWQQGF